MTADIVNCFVSAEGNNSSLQQSPAKEGEEDFDVAQRQLHALLNEDVRVPSVVLAPFRASLRCLCEDAAVEILIGCLRTNKKQRIGIDSLKDAAARLLAKTPQKHEQLDDAQAQISRKCKCGADVVVCNQDTVFVGPEKKARTETAGALSPGSTESGIASSAALQE